MNKLDYTLYFEVTKNGNLRNISVYDYTRDAYDYGFSFNSDGDKIEYHGPGCGVPTYALKNATPNDSEKQEALTKWLGRFLPKANKWSIERLKAFLWGEDKVQIYVAGKND